MLGPNDVPTTEDSVSTPESSWFVQGALHTGRKGRFSIQQKVKPSLESVSSI